MTPHEEALAQARALEESEQRKKAVARRALELRQAKKQAMTSKGEK